MNLSEMSKNIGFRTIDRKLWLTVSSICSRNKFNEAEFIKPSGPDKNDKDKMIQRYVAALLIMKKECPKTVKDIDELKTFKLIGMRALELGATIEDIQSCYNMNSNDETAKEQKVIKAKHEIEPEKIIEPKQRKLRLDFFTKNIIKFKSVEDVEKFSKKFEEDIISKNAINAQEVIDFIAGFSSKLHILMDIEYSGVPSMRILKGYDFGSYKQDEQWYIVPEGKQAKVGYDGGLGGSNTMKYVDITKNSLVYTRKTGNARRFGTYVPTYATSIIEDKDLSAHILRLAQNGLISKYINDFAEKIIEKVPEYMKDNNLFDTEKAEKIYVKWEVNKEPDDWFVWAKKYIPLYVNKFGYIPVKMGAWCGGVDYIKKENGKIIVTTFLESDNSDWDGNGCSLDEFLKKTTYSEHYKNYNCTININHKEKMIEKVFNLIKAKIDQEQITESVNININKSILESCKISMNNINALLEGKSDFDKAINSAEAYGLSMANLPIIIYNIENKLNMKMVKVPNPDKGESICVGFRNKSEKLLIDYYNFNRDDEYLQVSVSKLMSMSTSNNIYLAIIVNNILYAVDKNILLQHWNDNKKETMFIDRKNTYFEVSGGRRQQNYKTSINVEWFKSQATYKIKLEQPDADAIKEINARRRALIK